MNPNTQRLLRILSVIVFAVGLVLVVAVDGADPEAIEAALFAGLALFAGSFIT